MGIGVVDFTLDCDDLVHAIDQYRARGEDLRPVAERSTAILKAAVDDLFETEGFGQWKPSERALEQGGKTLQDKGLLAGTIQAVVLGDDEIMVGSNAPYGGFHLPPEKSGHDVTTGVMPVRDWLAFDEDEVYEEIGDLLVEHLLG